MPKRMLIDVSHPEETRVVVLDGHKVEEFDFEAASKRPLKGNIYLAKVTRVEPSLQAAFVEYGGNRQGFLAFSEIHPDYYQIPVADRMAILADQTERMMAEEDFDAVETATISTTEGASSTSSSENEPHTNEHDISLPEENPASAETSTLTDSDADEHDDEADADTTAPETNSDDIETEASHDSSGDADTEASVSKAEIAEQAHPSLQMESIGAPIAHQRREDRRNERPRPRRRQYKIQEVIKRRQVMLIQVVKEERGNKGASLTTFLSLAGRYCVLMPNTPRGGGISRKITNAGDRKRLKSAAQSLELPEGMGLIIRTAGANRTKVEIKRDYEYLIRLWDTVRELTLKSNAPALVYEEGSLIKRAIRDLYNKDISEILVDGEAGYRDAKDFMRMLMPSHAKNVKPYKESLPLFQHFHVESQLDAMFSPVVTLRSGGYIVINQTEALVSIDVNSGKATREHSIEETAHKTNLEAADEIARQLRLRDLAGLIVIDFIDMEDSRNDRNVEKRLYSAVKGDRARIQIGKISQFGLLEMSRQRLRAGVLAGSTIVCPHCAGIGLIRSTESAALRLLRALDEEGQKNPAANVVVKAPSDVTIYTLNQKRREIARIEDAYDLAISFEPQTNMMGGSFEIERTGARTPSVRPKSSAVSIETVFETPEVEAALPETSPEIVPVTTQPESGTIMASANGQEGKRKRRRRRRGGRGRGLLNAQQDGSDHLSIQDNEISNSDFTNDPDTEGSDRIEEIETVATPVTPSDSQNAFQNTDGSERHRRRRRRGRRGRRRDPDQNAGNLSPDAQVSFHDEPAQVTANEDTFEQTQTAPNEPSSPQWSFTDSSFPDGNDSGAHPGQTSLPEQAEAPHLDGQVQIESDAANEAPGEAPQSSEPRKGWWQRRFKI